MWRTLPSSRPFVRSTTHRTRSGSRRFAAEFVSQPFHFDERAAHTTFGGLGASGWHTAGVTMRLLVESDVEPAGRITG
jgi:acyl dehydratase